jgi:hypothetical protein
MSCLPLTKGERMSCLPLTKGERMSCLPLTKGERMSCLPLTKGERMSCLPLTKGERMSCLPLTKGERMSCLPLTKGERMSCLPLTKGEIKRGCAPTWLATGLLVVHLGIFATLHLVDGGHFRAMLRGDEAAWRHGERVGRSLCLATPPDALVASWKPLAVYFSGRGYYPGAEMGNWNMLYAEAAHLSDDEMDRLGVISRERLQREMQSQGVDVALAEIPGIEFPQSYVQHSHGLSDNPRSQIFIRESLMESPDLGEGCD